MTILFLDRDPRVAARYHASKHLIASCDLYAHLISDVFHMHPPQGPPVAPPFKLQKPLLKETQWAGADLFNLYWLLDLLYFCSWEIKQRSKTRTSKQAAALFNFLEGIDFKMPDITAGLCHRNELQIPLLIPIKYHRKDKVAAYRVYYQDITKDTPWKNKPYWLR